MATTDCKQYAVSGRPQGSHTIELPLSKSISARVLAISSLAGCSAPAELARCDDTDALRRALFGGASGPIDIGAAGTAMRFAAAVMACREHGGETLITGSRRMLSRPIGPLVDALRQIGACIEYAGRTGFPPIRINGRRLEGGHVGIRGDISSQFVSALLMIAPQTRNGLSLELQGTVLSRPYIDMTIRLMRQYGASVEWVSPSHIHVGTVPYRPACLKIEADWSAAAFWYEALALSSDPRCSLRLLGLGRESLQGDSRVASLMRQLGVETTFGDGFAEIRWQPRQPPEKLEASLADCPDLAQALVVACTLRGVPFCFSGLESLKIKETDRMAALSCELGRMGVSVDASGGTISYSPTATMPHRAAISTYEDHRMAMAFAPAAIAMGQVWINDPGVVSKSYPQYWEHLRRVGFTVKPSQP